MIPGEFICKKEDIVLNENKEVVKVKVANVADRPIQVGSHFHFFEVNKGLSFDRQSSYGMHLDIPSGTAVRFEPGEEKEVQLVAIGGDKKVYGLNGLVNGELEANKEEALKLAQSKSFL